ncbi:MAG: hypothetical protein QG589_41 [Patescibacteria group bacterium]|nr:hypothetical protein [Patescibacteria group bacterium]
MTKSIIRCLIVTEQAGESGLLLCQRKKEEQNAEKQKGRTDLGDQEVADTGNGYHSRRLHRWRAGETFVRAGAAPDHEQEHCPPQKIAGGV